MKFETSSMIVATIMCFNGLLNSIIGEYVASGIFWIASALFFKISLDEGKK